MDTSSLAQLNAASAHHHHEKVNLRVICRFKPDEFESEHKSDGKHSVQPTRFNQHTHSVHIYPSRGGRTPLQFDFDGLLPPLTTQETTFDAVAKRVIEDVLNGYNSTILCYGQTSGGKTHTIFGKEGADDPTTIGLLPRCVAYCIHCIKESPDVVEASITISCIEIYREQLKDLISPSTSSKLRVKISPSGEPYVENLTQQFMQSSNDAVKLIELIKLNRTKMSSNSQLSSHRSTCLACLTIKQKLSNSTSRKAKCYFGDLAGSEEGIDSHSHSHSHSNGDPSLSTLRMVIHALSAKKTTVPYHQSQLTTILRDSLGGNTKTTIIICCSLHYLNREETINTLRFGQRARLIENAVRFNRELSRNDMRQLLASQQQVISVLQDEIDRLKHRQNEQGIDAHSHSNGAAHNQMQSKSDSVAAVANLHRIEAQHQLQMDNLQKELSALNAKYEALQQQQSMDKSEAISQREKYQDLESQYEHLKGQHAALQNTHYAQTEESRRDREEITALKEEVATKMADRESLNQKVTALSRKNLELEAMSHTILKQLEALETELEAQQVAILAFERSKVGSAGYTPSGIHKIPDFPTASELLLTAHRNALAHDDSTTDHDHEDDIGGTTHTLSQLTPLPLSTTTPSTSPNDNSGGNRYLKSVNDEETKQDAPRSPSSPSSPSASSIRASHDKIKESLTNLRELIQSNFVVSTEAMSPTNTADTLSDSKKVTTELIAQYRNVLEQYHKLQRDYTETQKASSQRHEDMMTLKKENETILAQNERLRYEMEKMKVEFEQKRADSESAIDKQKVKAISHYLENSNHKIDGLNGINGISSAPIESNELQQPVSSGANAGNALNAVNGTVNIDNVLSKEPLPSSQSPPNQRMLLLHATNSGDTLMSNTTGSSNPHSRESSESRSGLMSTTNPELVVTDDMSFRSHSSGAGPPPSLLDGSMSGMTGSSYNSTTSNLSSLPLSMQRNYYDGVTLDGHSKTKQKENGNAKQEEWRKGLRQRFELIDTDNDGFISLEDFVAFTKQKNPNSSEEQIEKIFEQMDSHKNGRVTWIEFEKCFRRFAMKNMALKRLPIAGTKVDSDKTWHSTPFDENSEFSKLGSKGRLHAIRVWYDNVIYGFKCTWTRKSSSSPSKMKQVVGSAHLPHDFDAKECTEDVFMLRPDEYISCVTVWIGKEQRCVYGITVETTQNRWHEFGGGMGTPILLQPPEKHAIHAFYGGVGRNLNYIGAYALPRKDHHHKPSSSQRRQRRSSTSKSRSKSQSVSQNGGKDRNAAASSGGKRQRAATASAAVTKSASPPSQHRHKYPVVTQNAMTGNVSVKSSTMSPVGVPSGPSGHVHSQSAFVASPKQQQYHHHSRRVPIPQVQVEANESGGIQIAPNLEMKQDGNRIVGDMHHRNQTDVTLLKGAEPRLRGQTNSMPYRHPSTSDRPFTVQVDSPRQFGDGRKKSKKFSLWWGKK